jgi:hypothetical protein
VSTPDNMKTVDLKTTMPRLKIFSPFEQSEVQHLNVDDIFISCMRDKRKQQGNKQQTFQGTLLYDLYE